MTEIKRQTQTFRWAAGDTSACACKGPGAAPGSVCTSSSLSSGSFRVLDAPCTGFLPEPASFY